MQPQTSSGGSSTASCPSTKQLLDAVRKEISDFEAKKLTELKGELESFVNKQKGLVDQYQKAYPELRRKWLAQHADVQALYTQLKTTHDPLSDQWKALVSSCICVKQKDVDCLGDAIAKRKRCALGQLEYARDRAQAKFDEAKTRLDLLQALATKIDAALTSHGNWIKDIKNLPVPERATVLYLFWIRLLPAHRALMPEDLPKDCPVPGADETPDKICKADWDKKCPDDPWACTPPADGDGATATGDTSRRLPWLLPPDQYEHQLDCAWDDYRKAKNELAIAEANFKNKPDDLAAKVKEYGAARDGLEADILTCLKAWKPKDPCGADAEPAREQGV